MYQQLRGYGSPDALRSVREQGAVGTSTFVSPVAMVILAAIFTAPVANGQPWLGQDPNETDKSDPAVWVRAEEGNFKGSVSGPQVDVDGDGRGDYKLVVRRPTIVICVHGVWVPNARESWAQFPAVIEALPEPRNTELIYLGWGSDWAVEGSQSIGFRRSWDPRGMSSDAWDAADKLRLAVKEIRTVIRGACITVVAHSQGTAVAVAALQDRNLEIDNLVLLGSPLGERTVAKAERNTRLASALMSVRLRFMNLSSPLDTVVKYLPPDYRFWDESNKGIGHAGLPDSIVGIHGALPENGAMRIARDDKPPLLLCNYQLSPSIDVEHYGAKGWLRFRWTQSPEATARRATTMLLECLKGERELTAQERMAIQVLKTKYRNR